MYSPLVEYLYLRADAADERTAPAVGRYEARTLRHAAQLVAEHGSGYMLTVLGEHEPISIAMREWHSDEPSLDVHRAHAAYAEVTEHRRALALDVVA